MIVLLDAGPFGLGMPQAPRWLSEEPMHASHTIHERNAYAP
jgi:hypothetical protein